MFIKIKGLHTQHCLVCVNPSIKVTNFKVSKPLYLLLCLAHDGFLGSSRRSCVYAVTGMSELVVSMGVRTRLSPEPGGPYVPLEEALPPPAAVVRAVIAVDEAPRLQM